MSEFFSGITFPWQNVTPSDDASIRRTVLADGILSGCGISYVGSTLTMGAGLLICCGRQFRHTTAQNFAITGASSGFARLVITVDTTKTSSKESFQQIDALIEYATALNGFAQLRQDDINESGTVYQMQVCVISLGAGGISGIVSTVGNAAAARHIRSVLLASGWVASAAAGFQQNISVEGLTDDNKVNVYPVQPATLSGKLALAEETSKVKCCSRTGNVLTFEAWEEKPVQDISIIVEVVK